MLAVTRTGEFPQGDWGRRRLPGRAGAPNSETCQRLTTPSRSAYAQINAARTFSWSTGRPATDITYRLLNSHERPHFAEVVFVVFPRKSPQRPELGALVLDNDLFAQYVPTAHVGVEIGGGVGLHYHYGTLGQLEHGVNYADAYLRNIGQLKSAGRPLKDWPSAKGSTVKPFVLAGHRTWMGSPEELAFQPFQEFLDLLRLR